MEYGSLNGRVGKSGSIGGKDGFEDEDAIVDELEILSGVDRLFGDEVLRDRENGAYLAAPPA